MLNRWFLLFKTLAVVGLLLLWWAVWSVDLRVVKENRRGTEVVKSDRSRQGNQRKEAASSPKKDLDSQESFEAAEER